MVLLLLVDLLQHLLLVHLVRVEHGVPASLALRRSGGRILSAHLETCLTWNDASLTSLHLDLSWKSDGSSSSGGRCTACSTGVRALRLVQLNAA